jgi:hypothetical protein
MAGVAVFLFFAFLFVAMFLALLFAYQSEEERRALGKGDTEQRRVIDGPRFFASLEPAAPGAGALDPSHALLVQQLQEHVRREELVVAAFADEPSTDRLSLGYAGYVAAVVKEMESHIRRESLKVEGFVAEPSLEGLFRDTGRSAKEAVA